MDKKMYNQYKNSFDKNVELLKDAYEVDPENVNYQLKDLVERLGYPTSLEYVKKTQKNNNTLLDKNEAKIFLLVIVALSSLLLCLFDFSVAPLVLFGLIFFWAGLLIGQNAKGFGIIFLFSHGGTGFGLVIGSLLSRFIENPIINENPKIFTYYYSAIAFVSVCAFLYTVLLNLSDELKKRKFSQLLSIGLFYLAFIMTAILPIIANKLIMFRI